MEALKTVLYVLAIVIYIVFRASKKKKKISPSAQTVALPKDQSESMSQTVTHTTTVNDKQSVNLESIVPIYETLETLEKDTELSLEKYGEKLDYRDNLKNDKKYNFNLNKSKKNNYSIFFKNKDNLKRIFIATEIFQRKYT